MLIHPCRTGSPRFLRLFPQTLALALVFASWAMANGKHAEPSLVLHGQPAAIIVAGNGNLDAFAAAELQRYLKAFSGATLEIQTPEQTRNSDARLAWILVGTPHSNDLIRQASAARLIDIANLKSEGFVLHRFTQKNRTSLAVAGADEAGVLYGVYDLLERYGAVFLLTGDILPEQKPDWELKDINARVEPAFRRRGLFVSFIYPNRSIMSLNQERQFINQMAKLKMNYLQIFWFPYEPWLKYSYAGETKWMGDVARKETGYVLWARDFGSFNTAEMEVGREHFMKAGVYPHLAPPEFQHIATNEQAFEISQNYMRSVIDYAGSRKIKVWLAIDATSVVPNLARYTTRTLSQPFHPIFGTFTCPNNPVSLELNDARFKSLVATYPNAEGFFFYLPEAYPVCNTSEADRMFYLNLRAKYPGEREARVRFTGDIPQDDDTVVDSNSGSLYFLQKLIDTRDRIVPQVKVGIGGLGRLYLARFIQRQFPVSLPFSDMESQAIWTPSGIPMEMFGDMPGRETTLSNRIDDDSDMLGMQFNVGLYYKDHVLDGGLKYGLAGFDSQMNRDRGTETNTKFMAEGEWNPQLTPDAFYDDYSKRIFGEKSAARMKQAFDALEANEEFMRWTGGTNFPCCGPPEELNIAYEYSKQPDPFMGPHFSNWTAFLSRARDRVEMYQGSVKRLQEALSSLRSAQPDVTPRGKAYLDFLINRTDAYILHLETLIAWNQAYLDLDSAFLSKRGQVPDSRFVGRLDAVVREFDDTTIKAKDMADRWSEIIDSASDLGVLYRINIFMLTGTKLSAQLIHNVDNYYHGRDYVQAVDFGKIFVSWPVLSSVPWQSSEFTSAQ